VAGWGLGLEEDLTGEEFEELEMGESEGGDVGLALRSKGRMNGMRRVCGT